MIQFFLKSIRENKVFFSGFVLYMIITIILLLITNQGDSIKFFSDRRSMIGDTFFIYSTKLGEQWPYIIGILAFLFVKFRYSIAVLLTPFIVFLLSMFLKNTFAHPRPKEFFNMSGQLADINLIESIHTIGGFGSFPSGHTMSAFAVWGIIALMCKNKTWAAALFILLAILGGVSRVYLVQHFIKDISFGAVLGVLVALFVYYLQSRFTQKENHWLNKSLLSKSAKKFIATK